MSIVLTKLQEKYIYSKNRITAFCAARSCGKTFATAYLICNKMTHGKSVLAVAPTYPLLNSVLIKDTLDMFRRHKWKFDYNKTEKLLIIFNRNGSELARCYFRSADCYDTIRGISNVSVLVMDEAAYCVREAYEVALACLRGEHVRDPQAYLVSTPRGLSNWFSQIYLSEGVEQIHGTSFDNPYIDENFVDMLKSQYGSDEFIQQEIYATILDSTNAGVFKASDFAIMQNNKEHIDGNIIFGFDIGGSGDDYSAISVIKGNQILESVVQKTNSDGDLVSFVSFMVNKYNPKKINIDQTGLGHLLPSRLAPLFPRIEINGVNFGSSSKKKGYANTRSEMYFDLRNAIRNDGLHFMDVDKKIQDMVEVEMMATEYYIDNNTNFLLKKKSEIKKELKRSPDILDSLALACYGATGISKQAIDSALHTLSQPKKYYNNKSANYNIRR